MLWLSVDVICELTPKPLTEQEIIHIEDIQLLAWTPVYSRNKDTVYAVSILQASLLHCPFLVRSCLCNCTVASLRKYPMKPQLLGVLLLCHYTSYLLSCVDVLYAMYATEYKPVLRDLTLGRTSDYWLNWNTSEPISSSILSVVKAGRLFCCISLVYLFPYLVLLLVGCTNLVKCRIKENLKLFF